jgi:hypothetical protein
VRMPGTIRWAALPDCLPRIVISGSGLQRLNLTPPEAGATHSVVGASPEHLTTLHGGNDQDRHDDGTDDEAPFEGLTPHHEDGESSSGQGVENQQSPARPSSSAIGAQTGTPREVWPRIQ